MKPSKLASILTSLSLVGCAGMPGHISSGKDSFDYVPVVDMKNVDMAMFRKDVLECQNLALQVPSGANQALAGALIGGLFGVALNKTSGNYYNNGQVAGTAALMGGASGAVNGMTARQNVVKKCLSGRGYNVLS